MTAPYGDDVYESLTRQHAVKIECMVGVEECVLAAENVVGRGNLLAASRVNKAVVIFAKTVELANELIQKGVVLKDQLTPVLPLSSPSKKIILSNVPPFLKNEVLARELSRFGKLVSPIRKFVLSPRMSHMISYRRVVYMILKDGNELELSLKFKVAGFDYGVYVTSDTEIKCFGCGQTGHLIRACPSKKNTHLEDDFGPEQRQQGSDTAGLAVVVPPEEAGLVVDEPDAVPEAEEDREGTSTEGVDVQSDVSQEAYSVPLSDRKEPQQLTKGGQEMVSSGQTDKMRDCVDNTRFVVDLMDTSVNVDMVEDPVFKVPGKRKKQGRGKGTKQARKEVSKVKDGDSDSDGSESSWSVCSQDEKQNVLYTDEEIKKFLSITKGQKGVQVEEHFKDTQQFVHDVKYFRREGVFTALENFRLKKILTKLHKANNEDSV